MHPFVIFITEKVSSLLCSVVSAFVDWILPSLTGKATYIQTFANETKHLQKINIRSELFKCLFVAALTHTCTFLAIILPETQEFSRT